RRAIHMPRKRTLARLLPCLVLTLAAAGEAPPPAYPDHSKLLVVRDAGGAERSVKTPDDWRLRREHILLGLEAAMGSFDTSPPRAGKDVPLDLRVEREERLEKLTRKRISFAAAKDDRV